MNQSTPREITCFKAYDVRGVVPDQLNKDVATRIAWGLIKVLDPKQVVIGRDVRSHSPMLAGAISKAFLAGGVDVVDLGLCGTEEVYFNTGSTQADLGIMITASHNPAEYNGIKMVKRGAAPLTSEETAAVKQAAETLEQNPKLGTEKVGGLESRTDKSAYIDKLLSFIEPKSLSGLKVVANSGNGCAGPVLEILKDKLPLELVSIQAEPDSSFPNGIPNPLDPNKRADTITSVQEHKADFGVAFDGDFDRCFFFDEKGRFIEGYYIVALLARAVLQQQPKSNIIYDNRMIWATEEGVAKDGGTPVICRTGHTFIKGKMRESDAVYGGEMSAHHYFKDFYYCDSGILPFLLMAQYVAQSGQTLGQLVDKAISAFPCSGEINFRVEDKQAAIDRVMNFYDDLKPELTHVDGVSADFGQWRFNIRQSNTEPLLRLNIESRGDKGLVEEKVDEISTLIRA